MERRRLAGIDIVVRFHHRKQRDLWSAAASSRIPNLPLSIKNLSRKIRSWVLV